MQVTAVPLSFCPKRSVVDELMNYIKYKLHYRNIVQHLHFVVYSNLGSGKLISNALSLNFILSSSLAQCAPLRPLLIALGLHDFKISSMNIQLKQTL